MVLDLPTEQLVATAKAIKPYLDTTTKANAALFADKMSAGLLKRNAAAVLANIADSASAQREAIDGCKEGDPIACTSVLIRRSLIDDFAEKDARLVEGLSKNQVSCSFSDLKCTARGPATNFTSRIVLGVIVGGIAYAAYRFIRR